MRLLLHTFSSSNATDQAAVAVTPYTCIRRVLGLNLGWISGYSDRSSFTGGLSEQFKRQGSLSSILIRCTPQNQWRLCVYKQ
jgi:hypothetical protein